MTLWRPDSALLRRPAYLSLADQFARAIADGRLPSGTRLHTHRRLAEEMGETGAEVLAGINLPMLIKLASVRGKSEMAAAVSAGQEAGRKYINVASKLLAGESAE